MGRILLVALSFAVSGPADFEKAVLCLSGASVVEELSEEEMEKYRRFAAAPLDINAAGFSRLESCGLFTLEQAASIVAARSSSGDILSWKELSLLKGFTEEYAEAVSCFAVLRSARAPGQRADLAARHELMVRGAMKNSDGGTAAAGGLKYGFKLGEKAGLNWATRNTYGDPSVGMGTVSAAWFGSRHVGKIVAGDMALRFGQGLAVWTGFSLSGLSSVGSYRRNPTGISQTSSFSSEHKGLGIDVNFFSPATVYVVSAAYSFTGRLPVLNLTRVGRTSSVGVTATSSAVSADFRIGLPSFSVFGEACWRFRNSESCPAGAVFGVVWIPEYGKKVGAVARFEDNRLKPAAGYESTYFKADFEGKIDYVKRTEMYKLCLASGDSLKFQINGRNNLILKPSARLAGKYKPQESTPFRTDLRLDLDLLLKKDSTTTWNAHWRSDIEYSKAFSWHTYLEAGIIHGQLSAYVRAGTFHIDNWDDRIYVYERDLPGTFTCPALYGRGFKASLLAACKFKSHAVCMKISDVAYFDDRPSALEFKIQYSLRL